MKSDMAMQMRTWFNRATDCDQRLRESWAAAWGRGLPAGTLLLDAGAGDGHMREVFPELSYVALDINLRQTSSGTSALCCGDLHRLPLRTGHCHNVLALEVLEHVRHPNVVLEELARVVRPGGQICISVPQGGGEHEQPFDFFRFTSFSLESLAKDAGLAVEFISMKGGYFRRLSSEIRDLPFIVLPEHRVYRARGLVVAFRWVLVATFTLGLSTLILPLLDRFDRTRTYTTGYFCVFSKLNTAVAR